MDFRVEIVDNSRPSLSSFEECIRSGRKKIRTASDLNRIFFTPNRNVNSSKKRETSNGSPENKENSCSSVKKSRKSASVLGLSKETNFKQNRLVSNDHGSGRDSDVEIRLKPKGIKKMCNFSLNGSLMFSSPRKSVKLISPEKESEDFVNSEENYRKSSLYIKKSKSKSSEEADPGNEKQTVGIISVTDISDDVFSPPSERKSRKSVKFVTPDPKSNLLDDFITSNLNLRQSTPYVKGYQSKNFEDESDEESNNFDTEASISEVSILNDKTFKNVDTKQLVDENMFSFNRKTLNNSEHSIVSPIISKERVGLRESYEIIDLITPEYNHIKTVAKLPQTITSSFDDTIPIENKTPEINKSDYTDKQQLNRTSDRKKWDKTFSLTSRNFFNNTSLNASIANTSSCTTTPVFNKKPSLKQKPTIDSAKPISRKKMPNFALIHQRAYAKMENLTEMAERKAARAKVLLSGNKPASNVDSRPQSLVKSRRALRYSPKISKRNLQVPAVSKVVLKKIEQAKSRIPLIVPNKLPAVKKQVVPKKPPVVKKQEAVLKKPPIMKKQEVPQKPPVMKKQEAVKAVTNKSRLDANTVEKRRDAVQNVRTNRRFELLMKMRKGVGKTK